MSFGLVAQTIVSSFCIVGPGSCLRPAIPEITPPPPREEKKRKEERKENWNLVKNKLGGCPSNLVLPVARFMWGTRSHFSSAIMLGGAVELRALSLARPPLS
ncbi:Hypothetical predicted protein [Pelobates cultripes]|uniref:Uncharacterized protein n=1 Tax=Pelobates cultripes TaxID=61616 RepID=A0AAD1WY81_PELCU|nr:Hypothetical predicted protein [Pelobates cultripes]